MFMFAPPLSRSHAALRGLLAAILGILCLVWPGITIGVAVALFAIYCIADAVAQIGTLYGSAASAGQRLLTILLALVDLAAGVVAIASPGITAGVLVIVIGAWAIVGGAVQLAAAWQTRGSGSGWLTLTGVLAVIAGVVLVAWPGLGAVALAFVLGVYLVLCGATLLSSAAMTPSGADVADALP